MGEYKQVIVVRTDIKMSRGKLAAQVAHASVLAAFTAYHKKKEWFTAWWNSGQKKVVLKGGTEKELLDLAEKALKQKLPVAIVRNAGYTELEPGTLTAIAIGPAPSDYIDNLTGDLKLL
ncbi:MAG: peptidyl-tRNA hydrolase [Thermoprotei archaeon]|nr:MAG: peptidyl-tRNA hydrolase [Thermoprotei archaeon]